MIKSIIFDFDGVIIESVGIKTKAFVTLFKSEGADSQKKIINYHQRNSGISRFEKFKYIYQHIINKKLTRQIFAGLCQDFSKLVLDEVVKAPYVKGAEDFLNNFTKQYRCFVSSATPQDEIEDIINKRRIAHYFIAVFGAPKKKADIAKRIIFTYRYLPQEVVYIGDALSDYEAAAVCNINFIARINNNESLFRDINCLKIKDLTNLKSSLEKVDKLSARNRRNFKR